MLVIPPAPIYSVAMNIEYSNLETNSENREARLLGCRCFMPFYVFFFLSRFKNAVLAKAGGRIVGAVSWSRMKIQDRSVGYLAFGFTGRKYRGRGIGRETYSRAFRAAGGAETGASSDAAGAAGSKVAPVTAMILDDNYPSWSLFKSLGGRPAGAPDLIRAFGFGGFLRIAFESGYFFAPGGSLWSSGIETSGQRRSLTAVLIYLAINIAAAGLYVARYRAAAYIPALIAVIFIFRLAVAASAAALSGISGNSLRFRFNSSGWLLPLILAAFGSYMPFSGNFYPSEDGWKDSRTRRRLGICGLAGWLGSMAALIAVVFAGRSGLLPTGPYQTLFWPSYMLLVYDSAFFLMESMNGARVYRWNRPLCIGIFCLSLVILIGVF